MNTNVVQERKFLEIQTKRNYVTAMRGQQLSFYVLGNTKFLLRVQEVDSFKRVVI